VVHGALVVLGIVGPLVTGFLMLSTGAFTSAFVLAGAIAGASVLSVLIFVRPVRVEASPVVGELSAPAKRA
jgi:ACS family hexuronate transporter-like MFS transporter